MTCVATLQSINYYSKQSKVPFCFFFNTIKALKPLISHANWTIKVNAKWVLHHHVHVGVSLPRALFGYLMVIWCWHCQQTLLTLVYLTVLTTRGCFKIHTFFSKILFYKIFWLTMYGGIQVCTFISFDWYLNPQL